MSSVEVEVEIVTVRDGRLHHRTVRNHVRHRCLHLQKPETVEEAADMVNDEIQRNENTVALDTVASVSVNGTEASACGAPEKQSTHNLLFTYLSA